MTAFCQHCRQWVPIIPIDEGISGHEYQGHRAVDRRLVVVCWLCYLNDLFEDEECRTPAKFD